MDSIYYIAPVAVGVWLYVKNKERVDFKVSRHHKLKETSTEQYKANRNIRREKIHSKPHKPSTAMNLTLTETSKHFHRFGVNTDKRPHMIQTVSSKESRNSYRHHKRRPHRRTLRSRIL